MLGSARFLTLLGSALVCSFASLATVGCSASTAPADDEATESSESSFTSAISYDAVLNLQGEALRDGLFDLVKDHQRLGYNRAREVIFNNAAFLTADRMVECQYTGTLVRANGSTTVGGFNTEHTWPQSQGANREPAKSDLHHLFPSVGRANSARGNWPFGIVTCAELHPPQDGDGNNNNENGADGGVGGSSSGGVSGSSSSSSGGSSSTPGQRCSYAVGGSGLGKDASNKWAFEVRAEKRGNVARAKFYFAVRYNLQIPAAEEATLRAWHAEDPVDDSEVKRNDAVETLQKNRNPFVDHPEFVARIRDF